MARVTRLVIGEDNFNDAACGFSFKASVCEPTEEIDDSHIRVRRLLALFPGSTVETVLSKPAQPEAEKKEPEKKAEAKPEAPKANAPAPDAKLEPDAPAEPVVTVEAPGLPNSADPKELAKAVGEDHAAKSEAEVEPAKASEETGELEAVGEVVAADDEPESGEDGESADEDDAKTDAAAPDGK